MEAQRPDNSQYTLKRGYTLSNIKTYYKACYLRQHGISLGTDKSTIGFKQKFLKQTFTYMKNSSAEDIGLFGKKRGFIH